MSTDDYSGKSYPATIVDAPKPAADPSSTGDTDTSTPDYAAAQALIARQTAAAAPADVVVVKTLTGTRIVPVHHITDITFVGESPHFRAASTKPRNLLEMRLAGATAGGETEVGMMYLQNGLRWIPSYQVTIDTHGAAAVKLEATLINDLIYAREITLNLVVGVPTFRFADQPDPIGLQDTFARLSRYLEPNSATAYGFSNNNLITSQQAGAYTSRTAGDTPPPPDLSSGEDAFVYTLHDISLLKGQRMMVPIATFSLPYKDVYTLDLPPPQEGPVRPAYAGLPTDPAARGQSVPAIMHQIRLINHSAYPLTTAPALILGPTGRLLAQGEMTYTSSGAQTEIALTNAVDLVLNHADKELVREPINIKSGPRSWN